jgi:hypothetical protein
MLRKVFALAAVLGLTAVAHAVPTLTYTTTDLGSGLTGYDFSVHGNDAANSSFFVTITFAATSPGTATSLSQVKAFGAVTVNDQTNADTFNVTGGSGYSKALDTYVYNPFGANFNGTPVETTTTYQFSAGTGGGSALNDSLLAHIVANGSITYTGTISRSGLDTNVSGTASAGAPVPEPASLGVLALGGVALLARRRKA